jgi:glycosyltransferase involved in cell wall biosynthesis
VAVFSESLTQPLVVIPAYNEQEAVTEVVEAIVAAGFRVLVVDDGSTDQTRSRARAAGAEVVSLNSNSGVGVAIRTAFARAVDWGFDSVVQCDADGQHPVASIPALIGASRDADMVVGSRFLSAENTMTMGVVRRAASRLLAWSASHACGTPITDPTSGFRVIRQPLLGELAVKLPSAYLSDTYEVLVAAGRAGYRVREIPAPFTNRMTGVPSTGVVASSMHMLRCLVKVVLRREMRLQRPRR